MEAAGIGLRILDALVTAQAGGVQHRDIKPANVLLADDGRIVLTDFGIARHVGDETLTSAGLLVGSPNFLAPERARGLDSPGLASDLWSLGATLYAAVEGRPPFERNGPLPTLAAVVMDEPPPPQRAGPLRPVIDGLLIKNPEYRLDADRTRWWLQRALRGQGAPPPATDAAPSDPTRPLPQVGPPPPVEETPATDRPDPDSSAADAAAVAAAAASAGSAAQSTDAPRTPEAAATAPPAASPPAAVTEPAADRRTTHGRPGRRQPRPRRRQPARGSRDGASSRTGGRPTGARDGGSRDLAAGSRPAGSRDGARSRTGGRPTGARDGGSGDLAAGSRVAGRPGPGSP